MGNCTARHYLLSICILQLVSKVFYDICNLKLYIEVYSCAVHSVCLFVKHLLFNARLHNATRGHSFWIRIFSFYLGLPISAIKKTVEKTTTIPLVDHFENFIWMTENEKETLNRIISEKFILAFRLGIHHFSLPEQGPFRYTEPKKILFEVKQSELSKLSILKCDIGLEINLNETPSHFKVKHRDWNIWTSMFHFKTLGFGVSF